MPVEVREELCEEALRLARGLHRLLPGEPEVTGLLALILLTSARNAARADQDGALVLLADQDRSRWDRGRLAEGPAAGLAILDTIVTSSRLASWPQLHIARGALLAECGRHADAIAAYRDALALKPATAVRRHITDQIAALEGAAPAPTQET